MRIVIDLQGAQATNAKRGIGRYSLSLAQGIARNASNHEVYIVLNGLFPETILEMRELFAGLIPHNHILVWSTLGNVSHINANNLSRRAIAEKTREAFIASLSPDIVLITSLFEGLVDDAVTSIGAFKMLPTATILYDLIPLIHSSPYLDNPDVKRWYLEKIEHLKKSDLLLSISESSRQEAIEHLATEPNKVTNISTACESHFFPRDISLHQKRHIADIYGIVRPFVMYTGGIDHRKNIEGLIRAYSTLPQEIRTTHQLAIVCSVQDADRMRLQELAKAQGIHIDEMILTGYVPEDDLITLYNLCEMFVFPSWHEGFGLPALEAMACGKAVIGANVSSIPEVIGLEDALFEPKDDKALTKKILQVLTDIDFKKNLEKHALQQAQKFSWDKTAQTAISAIEEWFEASSLKNQHALQILPEVKKKLAYISPLPPERSGISYYSAELLTVLSAYYDIDVIINQSGISDEWINKHCQIRSIEWFYKNHQRFDRIIYHFGNSHFHSHMFDMLAAIPGILVLHDFFLSGIIAHLELTNKKPDFWVNSLYKSHGYFAVKERITAQDVADVIWKYPTNLEVLQNSLSLIVHSENSLRLAKDWYGDLPEHASVIPLLRVPVDTIRKQSVKQKLGLPEEAFVICSFGLLGPTKLNHRVLDAFIHSSLAQDSNCYLIFVGENHSGEYGTSLLKTIKDSKLTHRIQITGWTDTQTFRNYLAAADMAVQLRTLSRGETSAAVLDCINYGLPTVVNANGSMADLDPDAVWMLEDDFCDNDLIKALEVLYSDAEISNRLSQNARTLIEKRHNPQLCARMYYQEIEKVYNASDTLVLTNLINSISQEAKNLNNHELQYLARQLANTFDVKPRPKQLFVDISELIQRDAKSGIQRVVKNILLNLFQNAPKGYRIEPVFATAGSDGYYYAKNFTKEFLGFETYMLHDEPIDAVNGDIFLGLDLQPHIIPQQEFFLKSLNQRGVKVYFVVYDILPVTRPDVFVDGARNGHFRWLKVISQFDGLLCISSSVASEVREWIQQENIKIKNNFIIDYFHLGADIDNSKPSQGLPEKANEVIEALKNKGTFIMVGTLEPRKGHKQTLGAFEKLWDGGEDIFLVIVGKLGWMMDDFRDKLNTHPQKNKKLFWLEGISDEYLQKVYESSDCLIAASEGEGFGIPLIEAARHKLPIIARDIPVFREVAGEFAYYFKNDNDPQVIADSIKEWLELYKENKHPKSDNMPWVTWEESARVLINKVLKDRK